MALETVSQDVPIVKDNSLIRVDFINGETPVVSSLDVARHFQKKHKHVLEEIRKIIANTPKSFTGPNFRPSEYLDPTGRSLAAYLLTRDAFSLLVMGFTGRAATLWKLRYIEAFNALESAALANHAELAREAGYRQGLDEARALPAVRAQRQAGYLAGLKEGQRLQRRQDGLAVTERALGYLRRGLSMSETARLCGCHRDTLRRRMDRLRSALTATARPEQAALRGVRS